MWLYFSHYKAHEQNEHYFSPQIIYFFNFKIILDVEKLQKYNIVQRKSTERCCCAPHAVSPGSHSHVTAVYSQNRDADTGTVRGVRSLQDPHLQKGS